MKKSFMLILILILLCSVGAALAELESGEGLARFVEGHGLQSRFFSFAWESEGLTIDFNLPCERVLADEEDQALDAARKVRF